MQVNLPAPPPRPPRPFEPFRVTHVLHLLLTLVTFGLWAPIWLFVTISADSATRRERQRWERESADYRRALYHWQCHHQQVYGFVPPLP